MRKKPFADYSNRARTRTSTTTTTSVFVFLPVILSLGNVGERSTFRLEMSLVYKSNNTDMEKPQPLLNVLS